LLVADTDLLLLFTLLGNGPESSMDKGGEGVVSAPVHVQ
jgi:hypothetical protein